MLKYLIEKEFKQIFRNKTILKMILLLPLVQLLVLPLAADYEIKNINIAVVDHDRSSVARDLISSITASGYFRLRQYGDDYREAFHILEQDKADLILEIPKDFERALRRQQAVRLFVAVNAVNGAKASVGGNYLQRIISDYNRNLSLQGINVTGGVPQKEIHFEPLNWYNPFLNYNFFMVPGILVVLVTMIGAYMCSLNIVKEKELGTIEQVNVTPIRKSRFILGKLIPFWIIGMFVFSIGLLVIAPLVYHIFPAGSIVLIYLVLAIYMVAILGIGLLISTYSNTQQQAMSLAFFCMMLFLLMSGLFTSTESMPAWGRAIAYCNPVTHFIEVTRLVILKGSGFRDILPQFSIIVLMAIIFNTWAILNYKKTS
ncbi:ABC transporter permease [Rurimicrobium arvi]|uniref:ABC transporter permease n=2 Tax=Rurimicrobium arvi TaxID=2049916 RepID=A0ABP8MPX7_9BACT